MADIDLLVLSGYILVAVFIIGAFSTVYMIDRPRPPITFGTAMVTILLNLFFVWVVLTLIARVS
jgi:hypothetical protein